MAYPQETSRPDEPVPAYTDAELTSIVRLVGALADEASANRPWEDRLAEAGRVVDEGGHDAAGRKVACFSVPELRVDGNGVVADGFLVSASLFVAESRPPDVQTIRLVNDRLGTLFEALWGPAMVDVTASEPRSSWDVGGVSVSLDCIWANGAVGMVMISTGPAGGLAPPRA